MPNLSDYATVKQAAVILNKSESHTSKLFRTGEIKGVIKIGRTMLAPMEELEKYTPGAQGFAKKKFSRHWEKD